MCNPNYFDVNESADIKKLKDFNDEAKLFHKITAYPMGHWADVSATTIGGQYFNIELKNRECILMPDGRTSGYTIDEKTGEKRNYISPGTMIEGHKASDLFFDKALGLQPLYVNFYINAVLIFNLDKLTVRPRVDKYEKKIYSKGYKKFEIAKREYLSIKDACVYNNNGLLIKKAGEEWDTSKKNF